MAKAQRLTSQRTLYTADNSGTIITSLMAGEDGGVAKITAVSGSVTQVLNIIIDDGSVVVGSITLAASRTSIPADGSSSTAITATVKNTSGNPVPVGTPVVFTTNSGSFAFGTLPLVQSVTLYTTGSTGTVTTSLIAADSPDVAKVTATAGSKSQSMLITFTGEGTNDAVVGGISLSTPDDTIIANGISSTTIKAVVTDTNGDPMPQGTEIIFSFGTGGAIGTLVPDSATIAGNDGTVFVSLISSAIPGDCHCKSDFGKCHPDIEVLFYNPTIVSSITLTAFRDEIPADGKEFIEDHGVCERGRMESRCR